MSERWTQTGDGDYLAGEKINGAGSVFAAGVGLGLIMIWVAGLAIAVLWIILPFILSLAIFGIKPLIRQQIDATNALAMRINETNMLAAIAPPEARTPPAPIVANTVECPTCRALVPVSPRCSSCGRRLDPPLR